MNCTKCGEAILPGNTFCTNCGTKFNSSVNHTIPVQTSSVVSMPPVANQNPVNSGIICSNCKNRIIPGDAFCTYCGTKVGTSINLNVAKPTQPVAMPPAISPIVHQQNGEITCARCHKPVEKGNDFCLNCGARITALPGESNPVPVQTPTVAPTIMSQPQRVIVQPSVVNHLEDNKKGNGLAVTSLLLYFLSPICLSLLLALLDITFYDHQDLVNSLSAALIGLSMLSAIIVMIVGRIQYPKNGFLKAVMWIYIGLVAVRIVLFIGIIIIILLLGSAFL